jgi:hypothetical protein
MRVLRNVTLSALGVGALTIAQNRWSSKPMLMEKCLRSSCDDRLSIAVRPYWAIRVWPALSSRR